MHLFVVMWLIPHIANIFLGGHTNLCLTCVVPVFGRSGPRSAFVPSRSDTCVSFLLVWPKHDAVICGCRFRWVCWADHCWERGNDGASGCAGISVAFFLRAVLEHRCPGFSRPAASSPLSADAVCFLWSCTFAGTRALLCEWLWYPVGVG